MDKMTVDLPHSLGAAEARRRVEKSSGQIVGRLPPGASVNPRWNGDKLDLDITALGQRVAAGVEVQETIVRIEVALPAGLSFMRPLLEAGMRRAGSEILEDKRNR